MTISVSGSTQQQTIDCKKMQRHAHIVTWNTAAVTDGG